VRSCERAGGDNPSTIFDNAARCQSTWRSMA
jgi:hypothetical protein